MKTIVAFALGLAVLIGAAMPAAAYSSNNEWCAKHADGSFACPDTYGPAAGGSILDKVESAPPAPEEEPAVE